MSTRNGRPGRIRLRPPRTTRLPFRRARPQPEPPRSLVDLAPPAPDRAIRLRSAAPRPAPAIAIDWREPPEHRIPFRPFQSEGLLEQPLPEPGDRSETDHDASLADRLRALLVVPLDRLLPGDQTVLVWPAPFMDFQVEGVRALLGNDRLLLADDMGLGKGLAHGTGVLTREGWVSIEALAVGDRVIGRDGQAHAVTGVYPRGVLPVYRVRFNDGASVVVDGDHLWNVQHVQNGRRNPDKWRTVSTEELRGAGLHDGAGNATWRIPMMQPASLATDQDLPLHPYLLGALLGDGGCSGHSVRFSTADEWLRGEVERLLPPGLTMKPLGRCDWAIASAMAGVPNPLIRALRNLGVMGRTAHTKHVPAAYLLGNPGERLALLRGLMDTDGSAGRDGTNEFCSVSRALADDVAYLAQSLGGVARRGHKALPGGGVAYRVNVKLGMCPFALPRKAAAWLAPTKYPPGRIITAIEPAGEAEVTCIAVDAEDKLFVTEHCIVTHNTVQAIAAIRILCHRRDVARALLIVPASLIDQWTREFARWAPELRLIPIRGAFQERSWQWRTEAHVALISYESFRADAAASRSAGPLRRMWDLVVIDEAQKIKNRDADISREVKQLRRRRSWALTGTPLENREDDLASILEFVDHTDHGAPRVYVPSRALLQRHQELQLRRKKRDVLTQLPPKQIITVRLPLQPAQRVAYERAEREGIVQLRRHGESLRVAHILELITRLKQLCNRDPVSGESVKLADIRDRLQTLTAEGHRALLFSQYTDERFGVEAAARSLASFNPLTFTGALSGSARDAVIQRFKAEESHQALMLSLRAGGAGLNLQEASYVFHLDRWWNPAVERQAEDRAHRLGQSYPVTVIKYTCLDTIEERIEQVLAHKQQLFDEIVDDVSLDLAARLTRDDLFGLFGLAPALIGRPRRPEPPASPSTALRCARVLTARGWTIDQAGTNDREFTATKVDEVGLEKTLQVLCRDAPHPLDADELRALLAPLSPAHRLIVVTPAGSTYQAASLAREQNVAIWDEALLARFERVDALTEP